MSNTVKPEPFLKWLGGKRRLIPLVADRFPRTYGKWVEPFVGGGSLLFHFLPKKAFISDDHRDLINAYIHIRDHVDRVIDHLESLKQEHSATFFYECRNTFNAEQSMDALRAARFIYLNCKCFNGLCRYNAKGGFNAPLHKISHETRKIPHPHELVAVSTYLSNVEIVHAEFREAGTPIDEGDFVVLDPPYWPYYEQGFTTYTGTSFSERDQYDLLHLVNVLTYHHVKVMVWNSDVPEVRKLYKDYDIYSVSVKNCVGQKSYNGKKPTRSEVCIINYRPED